MRAKTVAHSNAADDDTPAPTGILPVMRILKPEIVWPSFLSSWATPNT